MHSLRCRRITPAIIRETHIPARCIRDSILRKITTQITADTNEPAGAAIPIGSSVAGNRTDAK